ncbi:MAG: alpha/beta hydrolase [Acidimicrobiales bacterium]|nr:alpha/beta hydrolase [Acidimicrobiales bacterium]
MPSEQFTHIAALLSATRLRPDTPLDEQRQAIETLGATVPIADGVTVEPDQIGSVPAVWLEPINAAPGRTLIYLHGGGYNIGSIKSHQAMVSRLAVTARARSLLIDYRLAPEHPFPAALDDAAATYRALIDEGSEPSRLVVAGESAGGGLTAALLLRLKHEQMPMPAACVLFSPWLDLAGSGDSMATNAGSDIILDPATLDWWAANYAGERLSDPLVSPLFGDLVGLPPLLIQVAGKEVLLDDARRFAAKAKAAGVDVELTEFDEMCHAWQLFAGLVPEADEALAEAGDWINRHLIPH